MFTFLLRLNFIGHRFFPLTRVPQSVRAFCMRSLLPDDSRMLHGLIRRQTWSILDAFGTQEQASYLCIILVGVGL